MSSQTELVAGRELDALIAEKVFGYVRCTHPKCSNPFCYASPKSPTQGGELGLYSTSIADAWKVVEKLKADGYEVSVHNSWPYNDGRRWCCDVMKPGTMAWQFAKADTAPEAICKASLHARAAILTSEEPK